jgi:GNAT superfamily N-acetyltransferase
VTYDPPMDMREEPLTDETFDEVAAFFRRSNPFAQKALGWDTGRFMDFRWATNAVRAAGDPDWFGRYCRVFRDGDGIRAVAVAEDGGDAEFIITSGEDPLAVESVLARLVEVHRERGAGLEFQVSDAEEWLRDIFVAAGMTEEKVTGHEWEYDLAGLPEPAPVTADFTIETLEGAVDRVTIYAGISDCFAAAFDREADGVPALLSLEQNPMFRPELSVFARSPGGTVVAYCRGTADPDNGVCGIDPVCTHPDFQRLGLGTAVVQRCFANQRALGGRFSYIGSLPEPAPGIFLYRSLGPKGRTVTSTWTYHFA